MDKFASYLESLMPGRIPKAILVLTIVLSGVLYKYSPFLQFANSPLTKIEEAGMRLIPALLLLIAGGIALVASLVYEIHKIDKEKSKLDRTSRNLAKSLLIIMPLINEEKTRLRARFSIIQSQDSSTYTKETIAEINSLNASTYFVEKISATIIRYIDSNDVTTQ